MAGVAGVAGVAGMAGVAGVAGVARTKNEAIAFNSTKPSAVNAAPVLPEHWQRRRAATRPDDDTNHNNEKPSHDIDTQSKIDDSRVAGCRRARRKCGPERGGDPLVVRRTERGGEWCHNNECVCRTERGYKHLSGDHPDRR